jgi:hypothetical protein
MKPYGRENKIKGGKPWKTDVHPKKGYINWWENMCDFLSRGRMKQIWKSDIKKDISENN